MSAEAGDQVSRRDFLKTAGSVAAALSASAIPEVHAAGGDTVQIALVGCGGRGTGAAEDALSSKGGDVKLVAVQRGDKNAPGALQQVQAELGPKKK